MPSSTRIIRALRSAELLARRHLYGEKPTKNHFILMYHRVIDCDAVERPQPGTWLDVCTFENQMFLLARRCSVLSLREFVTSIRSEIVPSKPVCAITFDDGWRDNFTNAFPILRDLHLPATIFLSTDYIEGGKPPWFECAWQALLSQDHSNFEDDLPIELGVALRRLSQTNGKKRKEAIAAGCLDVMKRLPIIARMELVDRLVKTTGQSSQERLMLNWKEVRTMLDSGIDIGAHTRTHAILTQLPESEMASEIVGAKADIEQATSYTPISFAYPNGDWNTDVRSAVSRAGFEIACTTQLSHCDSSNDCLALPRIGIHQGFSKRIALLSPLIFGLRLGIL